MAEDSPPIIRRQRSHASMGRADSTMMTLDRSLDSVVASLVDSDDLGPTIQAVFEGNKADKFRTALGRFIEKKEQEIESLCNYHYQEFIRSVDELLTVRLDTLKLEEHITRMNDDVQQCGGAVADQASELVRLRSIRQNVTKAMDALNVAQHCLDQLERADKLVSSAKYYHALMVTEQLEKVHLKRLEQNDFSGYIEKRIPEVRSRVKESVLLSFKDWLASMLDSAQGVGELLMSRWGDGEAELGVTEKNIFSEAGVSFTALYDCAMIHAHLGAWDEFQQYYRENRRLQANLALQPPFGKFEAGCSAYFAGICGFFLTEAEAMKTTDGLIMPSSLISLWDLAVAKIRAVLLENSSHWTSGQQFIEIKDIVMRFASSLAAVADFDISQILDFWEGLWEKYVQVIEQECAEKLQIVLENEDYAPMLVSSQEEFDALIAPYSLDFGRDDGDIVYPVAYPYSMTVPQCAMHVTFLVQSMFSYITGLRDMEDLARKATDKFLARHLNERLMEMVTNVYVSVKLSQVVQVSVNAAALAHACQYFEELHSKSRRRHVRVRLTAAKSSFEDTRTRTEDLVMQLVNANVDELMSLATNINWTPSAPISQPHDFLNDLERYLSTTLTWLIHMPAVFRVALHFNAFHHVAAKFMSLMCSDDVKRINLIAFSDLDIDLAILEKFAENTGIEHLGETFHPLRQLITLFQRGSIEEILDPAMRESRYGQVDLVKLVIVLDKFKEVPVYSSHKSKFKMKKRTVDQVAKKLREFL